MTRGWNPCIRRQIWKFIGEGGAKYDKCASHSAKKYHYSLVQFRQHRKYASNLVVVIFDCWKKLTKISPSIFLNFAVYYPEWLVLIVHEILLQSDTCLCRPNRISWNGFVVIYRWETKWIDKNKNVVMVKKLFYNSTLDFCIFFLCFNSHSAIRFVSLFKYK